MTNRSSDVVALAGLIWMGLGMAHGKWWLVMMGSGLMVMSAALDAKARRS